VTGRTDVRIQDAAIDRPGSATIMPPQRDPHATFNCSGFAFSISSGLGGFDILFGMSLTANPSMGTDPRYPIGKFRRAEADLTDHTAAITSLAALPEKLHAAVDGLGAQQLDTPYREGGWTVRQLVHHVADSHMNSYVRMRLALTEDWPTIKPYNEQLWAQLSDASTAPAELSLNLLTALHQRWVLLLGSLSEEQWQRGYTHPENGRQTLAEAAALYAWHSRHHVAHITELRRRRGW
jgi:hypothetical protein